MICPECNREIPDVAKFCSYCGCTIQTQRNCPACGEPYKAGAVFCAQCGMRLGEKTPGRQNTYGATPANGGYAAPHTYDSTPAPGSSYVNTESVTLNYSTGTNTIFGAMSLGKLTVSPAGVNFAVSFTLSSKNINHSYRFDEIQSTEFKMTRAGLQPYLSYRVTLKNGTVHNYIYSIIQKAALQRIDATIRSQMQ